jgi:hypothetical protein
MCGEHDGVDAEEVRGAQYRAQVAGVEDVIKEQEDRLRVYVAGGEDGGVGEDERERVAGFGDGGSGKALDREEREGGGFEDDALWEGWLAFFFDVERKGLELTLCGLPSLILSRSRLSTRLPSMILIFAACASLRTVVCSSTAASMSPRFREAVRCFTSWSRALARGLR